MIMFAMRHKQAYLGTLFIIGIFKVGAQECNAPGKENFPFTRTFLVFFEGTYFTEQGPTTAAIALGNCDTMEGHAGKMMAYFSSFGFDMTPVKDSAYLTNEQEEYVLSPAIQIPPDSDIIIAGTYKGTSQYMNAPIRQSAWSLTSKLDKDGPKGMVPANHSHYYGSWRFSLNGKDECVTATSQNPAIFKGLGPTPFVINLSHPEWKEGSAQGSLVIENNGTFFRYQFSMIFPPFIPAN